MFLLKATLLPFLKLRNNFCPFVFLGYIRSSRIGHFALDTETQINLFKKICKHKKNILIFAIEKKVCNKYLLDYFRSLRLPRGKIVFLNNKFLFFLTTRMKAALPNHEAFLYKKNIQDNYSENLKRKKLFIIAKSDQNKMTEWLEKNTNFNPQIPIVFLHNRDSAYLNGSKWKYHSYRDFSPKVFLPIIKKYKGQFNFVRGGWRAAERLKVRSGGVLDLPFTRHSELVDILFQERSIFYFGSDSGCNSVSLLFKKPLAGINYPSTCYGFLRRNNIYQLGFIPKKLVNIKTGAYIGLKEMYEKKWINLWRTEDFQINNLRLINNTEEEVLEYFEATLSFYQCGLQKELIQTPEQEEFWRIVTFYEPETRGRKLVLDNCFIGNSFLKKNLFLIQA